MEFRIRPTVPEDLEEMFRIMTHPLVKAQQYPIGLLDSVERWRRHLFGATYRGPTTNSTILVDDKIAGYIERWFRRDARREIRASYGWNLAPEYWGRGLMPAILAQDFTSHFTEPRFAEIFIDCFRDNARCIRVLEKLNCRPTFISPIERVETMIRNRCPRWVLRHRMTRAMWEVRRAMNAPLPQ